MSTFTGVFPTNEVKIEVDTSSVSSRTATPETTAWKEVADIESANFSIETGVETWFGIKEGGWQKALATSKSISISLSGKRSVGDLGNDYIASKWNKNGQACNSSMRFTFPDGDIIVLPCVLQVTALGLSDAPGVAPLECDVVSDGPPTYTEG